MITYSTKTTSTYTAIFLAFTATAPPLSLMCPSGRLLPAVSVTFTRSEGTNHLWMKDFSHGGGANRAAAHPAPHERVGKGPDAGPFHGGCRGLLPRNRRIVSTPRAGVLVVTNAPPPDQAVGQGLHG